MKNLEEYRLLRLFGDLHVVLKFNSSFAIVLPDVTRCVTELDNCFFWSSVDLELRQYIFEWFFFGLFKTAI